MNNTHSLTMLANRVSVQGQAENDNDGRGGGRGDAGQRKIDAARYFKYGLNQQIPPEWANTVKQMNLENDPEYLDYVRLHKKFGDI